MRLKNFLAIFVLILFAGCGSPENDQGGGGSETNPQNNPQDGTSGDSQSSVSFVAFGDWGTGDSTQKNVADALKNYCATEICEFVLTLGDNILYDGVSGTDDPQWQTKYRDVYGSLNIPFYAALGNHDLDGNYQAEIDYSLIDSTWNMPAMYYSFTMPDGLKKSDGLNFLEIFIITSSYPHFRGTTVQNWLKDAIETSQAKWKILAMHHPVISNGNHGSDDQGNNEYLMPIICNKVDLELGGHDHNFSHMRSAEYGCPVEQLIIGTGGQAKRAVDAGDSRVISTASMNGFGWFRVTEAEIEFRMIGTDGNVVYTTTWEKP